MSDENINKGGNARSINDKHETYINWYERGGVGGIYLWRAPLHVFLIFTLLPCLACGSGAQVGEWAGY